MATKKDERSESQRKSGAEVEHGNREIQESYSKPGEAETYSEKGFLQRSEGNKLNYSLDLLEYVYDNGPSYPGEDYYDLDLRNKIQKFLCENERDIS